MSKRSLFMASLLCCSCAILTAQGYLYTFEGTYGHQLDGSYIILSNSVPGGPTLADLLDVKILDNYPGPTVFDVSVQGFNVTDFGPQGFTGSVDGSVQSYLPPTGVQLVGIGGSLAPGIYASNDGFFPGNPAGEAVLGTWVVTDIPEPQSLVFGLLALTGLSVRTKRRRKTDGARTCASWLCSG
jgi:hypothetical protein